MKQRKWLWVVLGAIATLILICGLCTGGAFLGASLSGGRELGLGEAVGIVRVEGAIMAGRTSPFGTATAAYSEQVVEHLRKAGQDAMVRAIVLRVDSPGGSVVASDEIYHELLALKAKKPVVVSMGEMAASGGYYIACAADKIVANPATLTGSIGVITMVPNVEELMSKIGVEMVVIKSGALKDELSPYREMTKEERELWQQIINETYEQFVGIVAQGRGMDVEEVRELAEGQVYTGRQARELGLVDELGNLPQAIDLAAELGGIVGKPRIVEYRRPPTLFEVLMGALARQPLTLDQFLGTERRFSLQYLYVEP
jgi:protease-4